MSSERGFALVTVVLLMIGLAVLATGLLFAAAQNATVASTLVELARARHGAEAAVAIALEQWQAPLRSLDPVGEPVQLLHDAAFDRDIHLNASSRRIAPGSYVVTGSAIILRGAMPPVRRSAARFVHSLDADGLGAGLDAALTARRVSIAATAAITPPGAAPARDPLGAALCARWPSEPAIAVRALADSVSIAEGASLNDLAILPDADPLRVLDPLAPLLPALRRHALPVGADSVTPQPVAVGLACDTTVATNWGASEGPCAGLQVLRHADASLTVNGGYGKGVLLADGDVTLDGGVVFSGVIVAAGTVTVRDANMRGAIVASAIDVAGGSVAPDRCAIADALALAPQLRAAHPPARSWLPTFD